MVFVCLCLCRCVWPFICFVYVFVSRSVPCSFSLSFVLHFCCTTVFAFDCILSQLSLAQHQFQAFGGICSFGGMLFSFGGSRTCLCGREIRFTFTASLTSSVLVEPSGSVTRAMLWDSGAHDSATSSAGAAAQTSQLVPESDAGAPVPTQWFPDIGEVATSESEAYQLGRMLAEAQAASRREVAAKSAARDADTPSHKRARKEEWGHRCFCHCQRCCI